MDMVTVANLYAATTPHGPPLSLALDNRAPVRYLWRDDASALPTIYLTGSVNKPFLSV